MRAGAAERHRLHDERDAAPLPWMRSVPAYAVLHMNGERLRLAAFGVGRMGQVHLEHLIALHQRGEIALVAMGDRFGPTLSSACRLLNELGWPDLAGIAQFGDPDAMAAAARLMV